MRRLAIAWLAAAGCHGTSGGGASCQGVANRLFVIAQQDLGSATVDDELRRQVHDQLPAIRDALAETCRAGNWSAAVRDCLADAGDHEAFQACEQQLTDDQRRALDAAASGARPAAR